MKSRVTFIDLLSQNCRLGIWNLHNGRLIRTYKSNAVKGEMYKSDIDPSGTFSAIFWNWDQRLRLHVYDTIIWTPSLYLIRLMLIASNTLNRIRNKSYSMLLLPTLPFFLSSYSFSIYFIARFIYCNLCLRQDFEPL